EKLVPGSQAFPYLTILSAAQLHRGRKLAYAPWMVVMAFRKDERRFWLAKLRRPLLIRRNLGSALPSIRRWGHFDDAKYADSRFGRMLKKSLKKLTNSKVNASAGLVDHRYKRYLEKPLTAKVIRWAESRNESAQVLYNLACFYAIEEKEEELKRAVELLEQTQTHRYAQEIHASWVQRDPDLERLRESDAREEVGARYQAFIALMKGVEWVPKVKDGEVELISAPTERPDPPLSTDAPVLEREAQIE
ncbi:MAG: hypothetical protein OK454_12310, partial [Thaumarchaeota archaeon]|nr:hypothetical protein [Nitrososphaerota archaeon]